MREVLLLRIWCESLLLQVSRHYEYGSVFFRANKKWTNERTDGRTDG
jgi:hypothetical protein